MSKHKQSYLFISMDEEGWIFFRILTSLMFLFVTTMWVEHSYNDPTYFWSNICCIIFGTFVAFDLIKSLIVYAYLLVQLIASAFTLRDTKKEDTAQSSASDSTDKDRAEVEAFLRREAER